LIASRHKMSARGHFEARFLQEEDFARFNYWLWISRLRSIAGLLIIATLAHWAAPASVPLGPIVLVCAADLVPSLFYHWWLRSRRYLRLLTYVQLMADTLAIIIGLSFITESPPLFHFVLLLVVVPATMIEWQCGLVIAMLATAGHVVLLGAQHGELLSVGGLLPPATFFLVAGQSLFYAQHLAQKNVDLAAGAKSLNESNQRLEEEAAISGALLRAAQALTTSLDPHEILERLNDIIRKALGCDWSVTLLHDKQRDVYRVAAVSGTDARIVDEVRSLEFPVTSAALFTAVRRHGVVAVEDRTSGLFPAPLMERWQVASFLCADLQRAGASVGVLAAGFNQRAGAFSAREQRLFRSIAQQAALALENARLVEGLRAASQLKSEFIGTMSHELRSPLNVVIGYVDLLIEGDMGLVNADQREALERVRQHALQLLDLIQETLDVNRLEAGLLPVDLETFTVREFLDDVRDSIPADWMKRDVQLVWTVASEPILMRSDRGKLKKVLRNLIHNALKFTERGGVTVEAEAGAGWVDLSVTDTGIGISEESLPIIFDMFRQIDGSTTRRHGGVGLGLYIVKQLVRALGGDVSVTSRLGAGSTFRVRLRRSDAKSRDLPEASDAPLVPAEATDAGPHR
jgi:signal transduction histidine kinase